MKTKFLSNVSKKEYAAIKKEYKTMIIEMVVEGLKQEFKEKLFLPSNTPPSPSDETSDTAPSPAETP
jgi:hypothetical protein